MGGPVDVADHDHHHTYRRSSRVGRGQFRMGANVYKIESDSSHRGSSLKEENSVTLDFRRSSSKRASGAPMRALIDEEMSRDLEVRHQAPSVIARLMGLDTLPPPSVVSHKQQKEKPSCVQKESSIRLRGRSDADRSVQRSTSEHLEFKDVYEVTELSKFEKHEEKPIGKGSLNGNEDLRRQELLNTKHLSTEERLQNYRNTSDALEDVGLDKDAFMKFHHEPNSNHLHDLKRFLPSPEPSNITILRPSNNNKYGGSSDVLRRSVRKAERYTHCSKDISLSRKPMTDFAIHSLKEQESPLHKLSKSQYTGKTDSRLHPTRIVVLKPSLEKAHETERDVPLPKSYQNLQFDFTRHGEFQSSGIHELPEEGRERHKLFDSSQVMRHKTKGSREIARDITEQMRLRHTRDESSRVVSGMSRVSNSKASQRTSDNFHDWNNNYHPSTSYSSESSVSREARKRLSDRWKMTHRSQGVGLSGRGSSTLGEMLALYDTETPRRTFDSFEAQKVHGKNARHEVLFIQGRPLGTSSRGGWKDGCFTNLPRSRHSDSGSDSSDNSDMLKDVLNFGPIDSLHGYSIRRRASRRRFRCGSDKLHSFHSGGEENKLPVQDVHVKMEDTRNIDTVNNLSEENKAVLSELFDNKANKPVNNLSVENSMNSEFINVELAYVSSEEQVHQAEYVESPASDLIDKSIEEESSLYLQEDIQPSHCDRVDSESLVSSKEAEQPSPNSVLEPLSEEETPSSQCFGKISADLQGLRMQLQLLKLESEDTCGDDPQMLVSDDETGRENQSTLGSIEHAFGDDEERDFSYLLDVLVSSGIHGANSDRLFSACYSPEYPVDPAVFENLEKKYEVLVAWSKSKRKLLFDHINSILAEMLAPCMDLHPWVNSKSRLGPIWPPQGLAEAVLQIVVGQSKELCKGNPDDKVLDTEWLEIGDDIDMIGREIERMLKEELLEDLVSEFISPRVL